MLIIEQGQMEPNRVIIIIKKDWTPDRIGRAHRSLQPVTQADEFVQTLLKPSRLPTCQEPQPVEMQPNVDRLVEFLNR